MLNSLRLQNFKCFEDVEISLCPLTVLSGINGMGKSSVLQSLLLLRQSSVACRSGIDEQRGILNGPLICLGSADDVLFENAGKESGIRISLNHGHEEEVFEFGFEKGADALPLREGDLIKKELQEIGLFGKNFSYLTAERIGPRTSFTVADREIEHYNRMGSVGEYTACMLARDERRPLKITGLCHPAQELRELKFQVEAWLSEIGQSARIHVQEHRQMDLVSLEFSFLRNGLPTMNYRPSNVGFGLTYALPVFVAVLSSQPGGLVLIENPEAHLHPKGQVAMGKFLAVAANCGLQVVIETHSDHVLNGIRLAAKGGDIACEKVAFHFFDLADGETGSAVISPRMDKNGRLDQWPEGFFDEWEKALMEIL